jgi:glycosyltransferase involved in cell wall biosynthesis
MDLVFASSNPHLPQSFGGVEFNTHQLSLELKKRGHKVAVLTILARGDLFGLQREARLLATRRKVWIDHELGYPVYRARRPWEVVAELPHFETAILTNGRMLDFARGFSMAGTRSVAYLHGVIEFTHWSKQSIEGPARLFSDFWALSEFTAQRFYKVHGISSTVILPIFYAEQYRIGVTGRHVTFINPVPEKGVNLALEIAALCPDIPFVYVLGWPLRIGELYRLKSKIRRLPNVQLRDRTYDIRLVHKYSKILLVPTSCHWEETWGRVASEAQINGIPVVASDHGALPESVGKGGILLSCNAPAESWASAIRNLWTDNALYSRISEAATEHSQRSQLNPERQIELLLASLENESVSDKRRASDRKVRPSAMI